MSSSDFRHIANNHDAGRAERLFKAAVSAFCSLTRPSRRDVIQLEDLALPLFDAVSPETRRYVAAALSECHPAPPALARRLADEAIDIAAPVLMRSRALSDVDLVALIGRHGLVHARAIGRRENLNPVIAKLVAALESTAAHAAVDTSQPEPGAASIAAPVTPENAPVQLPLSAENARQRLRSMMLPSHQDNGATLNPSGSRNAGTKLRETALTGNLAFFQTALADALDIDFRIARSITEGSGYAALMAALRVLDISDDKAFLIASAVRAGAFGDVESIRIFLDRYRLMNREDAADALRGWRNETAALSLREPTRAQAPDASARTDDNVPPLRSWR